MTNTKPRSKMSPSQRYWPVYLDADDSLIADIKSAAVDAGVSVGFYLIGLHKAFGKEPVIRTAKG